METALLAMMGALLAMMGALLAMMTGMFLKMVDMAGRVGRLESALEMWLRHTHNRNTGQPVAAMPADTD